MRESAKVVNVQVQDRIVEQIGDHRIKVIVIEIVIVIDTQLTQIDILHLMVNIHMTDIPVEEIIAQMLVSTHKAFL